MTPFEAFAHALTTIPTGGFSTKANSIEEFGAGDAVGGRSCSWCSAALNFALLYRAFVRRQPRVRRPDEELRLYLALLALGAIVVGTEIWTEDVHAGEAAVRARACSRPSRS